MQCVAVRYSVLQCVASVLFVTLLLLRMDGKISDYYHTKSEILLSIQSILKLKSTSIHTIFSQEASFCDQYSEIASFQIFVSAISPDIGISERSRT